MLLSEKSALVTGAANRLGAQIARTLHENGANLIIHYRDSADAAEALAADLNRAREASAICHRADLASAGEVEQLGAAACDAWGGLDILVNNASAFYPTPFGAIDARAWDDLLASNYRAPLFLSQACYPALRASRGCIVNMVDIYATRPLAGHSVYCSAKAANQMLVKSLALELAPEVRVNGIAPGAILWPATGGDEAARKAALEEIPLHRLGGEQSIADTVMFLVKSDYITGEIVRVDGGRMLR
jgi:pteridine reductase